VKNDLFGDEIIFLVKNNIKLVETILVISRFFW